MVRQSVAAHAVIKHSVEKSEVDCILELVKKQEAADFIIFVKHPGCFHSFTGHLKKRSP